MSNAATPRILFAEDDENIRETTSILLSLTGAEVQAVASGREAAQALAAGTFELVVTDLLMPDGDGYWLLDHIRCTAAYRHLPVLMLSAHADTRHNAVSKRAGADEYLAKPFDPEQLITLVQTMLVRGPHVSATGATGQAG